MNKSTLSVWMCFTSIAFAILSLIIHDSMKLSGYIILTVFIIALVLFYVLMWRQLDIKEKRCKEIRILMKKQKILEIISLYKEELKTQDVQPLKYSGEILGLVVPNQTHVVQHSLWMILEMEKNISGLGINECNRRLGIIQGCLLSTGLYKIIEI